MSGFPGRKKEYPTITNAKNKLVGNIFYGQVLLSVPEVICF